MNDKDSSQQLGTINFSAHQLENSICNLNQLIAKIHQSLNEPDAENLIENLRTQNDQDSENKTKLLDIKQKLRQMMPKMHRKNKLSTVMEQSITQSNPNSGRFQIKELNSNSIIMPELVSNQYQKSHAIQDKQQEVAPYKKIRGIRKFTSQKNSTPDIMQALSQSKNSERQLKSRETIEKQLKKSNCSKLRKGLTLISCSKNVKSQQNDQNSTFKNKKKNLTEVNSSEKEKQIKKLAIQHRAKKKIEPFYILHAPKENQDVKKGEMKLGTCLSRQNPRDFFNKRRIHK